LTDRSAIQAY